MPPILSSFSVGSKLRACMDELRFYRSWLIEPRTVGAIRPSGPQLAKAMAAQVVDPQNATVLELGPGTGPVTQALLDVGVRPENLFVIEYSEEFCKLLRKRFKGVQVVQGDAFALDTHCAHGNIPPQVSAVISSLPLLNQPVPRRTELLNQAHQLLEPGQPFIQFSYAWAPPIDVLHSDQSVERRRFVLRNVPPAKVWAYPAK